MCFAAMVTDFIVPIQPLPYVYYFGLLSDFISESQMASEVAHLWDIFNPKLYLTSSVSLYTGSAN